LKASEAKMPDGSSSAGLLVTCGQNHADTTKVWSSDLEEGLDHDMTL